MTLIEIHCPKTWYDQCEWIRKNCTDYVDHTYWAAWDVLGSTKISFSLKDDDALMFKLKFQ